MTLVITGGVGRGAGDAADAVGELTEQARSFGELVIEQLPRVATGIIAGGVALALVVGLARTVERALGRTRADYVAVVLLSRIVRLLGVIGALLLGLSISGVAVGSVLAALAVVGVAVGLAVQGILENFIAGIILMIRKPFAAGDQVRTGDFEGVIDAIDLRVTRIIDYDGELILVPNRDVYNNPLINLTRRGTRRTVVMVGVDYRDDHDDARAVILEAVRGVDGVLDHPEPDVLLTELGESSVNFEVRYWTLPDIRSVRYTQDRVLAAAKRGIQDAGMTIPWPIRTLIPDATFHLSNQDAHHG
ncbi:MAG TPA: mechanosensitive ion channel domain-containing protein [Euzebyales bacterium]|nr:mechanosensitive ion channel domain-containing protein [Euzebyales bacterium]